MLIAGSLMLLSTLGSWRVALAVEEPLGAISEGERLATHRVLVTAECARVSCQDSSQIAVRVEPIPLEKLMGCWIVRGYDVQYDPSWIYVVGLCGDEVLRIKGFPMSDYADMVKRWLHRGLVPTGEEAQRVVGEYFGLVENWSPGLVQTPEQLKVVQAAVERSASDVPLDARSCISLPRMERRGEGAAVLGTVFDSKSQRTECVDVVLSKTEGFEIVKRRIIIAKEMYRF